MTRSNSETTLTFYGGVNTTTGAHFVLESQSAGEPLRVAIDCGLEQGGGASLTDRKPLASDPKSLDALFITHAHIDHIGRIPELVANGFNGPIYATAATRDLTALMLEDAYGVMTYEAKKESVSTRALPYKKKHIEESLALFEEAPYGESINKHGITATFHSAGHILGSAMVRLELADTSLLFTGDLGGGSSVLLPPRADVPQTDYVVMESVYGDRRHEEIDKRTELLKRSITKTIERGGKVMIPVFALERTQDILYEINNFVESGEIANVPTFLDSPLAIHVTDVFSAYPELYNQEVQEALQYDDNVFSFANLKKTDTVEASKRINDVDGPKIILAGAGMSTGGRIVHHELHHLSDPKSTIIFVGYQVPGTLGRKIQDGQSPVHIFDNEVTVNAEIDTIDGYSAHADMDELLGFANEVKEASGSDTTIFTAMGEPQSRHHLTQRINDYVGIIAKAPQEGSQVVL